MLRHGGGQCRGRLHFGERTWQLRYGYDLKGINLPGWTFKSMYQRGDNIKSGAGDMKEWARDLRLAYTFASGPAKGLNAALRFGSFRTEAQRSTDEYRVIVDYPISLF